MVAYEMPTYFQAGKGQVAASSGALVKLVFLVGSINQALYETKYISCHQVTPIQWKGQLPKDVAAKRIMRILGDDIPDVPGEPLNNHVIDAIGIGLYLLGEF